MKRFLQVADAQALPFADSGFDLVIPINAVHNLALDACKMAVREIERVSRAHAFVTMDAWCNEHEHENMLRWNPTALTLMHVDYWISVFAAIGYIGDYYWFIAE